MRPDSDPKQANTIILEGITGSTAYGLATPTSDEDVQGIFVVPTSRVIGLKEVGYSQTYTHTEPDWCYHEVGKWIEMALKGNPTVTEMLWLEGYLTLTKQGRMLVDNRHLFLSTPRIRGAYGGYAYDQISKLNARGGVFGDGRGNRYEKHARHCFRLLLQGEELLKTGKLTVRVTPEQREQLFEVGKLLPHELVTLFGEKRKEFDQIESVLPDKPNLEEINKLLLKIRKATW